MAKIKNSIIIKAPLDRVFDYMTHPENLPEIWPSMVQVSNVKRQATGAHNFDWVYKMAGLHFKGHAQTTEVELNKRVVLKNEAGIPSTFIWTYGGENGGTKVALEVEYTVPVPLLDKLAAPFIQKLNEREALTMLENLRLRMEVGVKPEVGAVARHAH